MWPDKPRIAGIPQYVDRELLRQIAALNLRGLQVICELHGTAATAERSDDFPLTADDWRALDEAARERIADAPYLLFEISVDAALAETGAAERSAASALPAVADAPARYSPWSAAHPRAFAGAVLHFAWHVAHTRPVAAPFVLGLPPQACAALQRSSPHGLDWLADAAPHWLRLRWHDDESHWRRRLVAARDNDLKGLRAHTLVGLQRLAGRAPRR
jgi:hypothetical protein